MSQTLGDRIKSYEAVTDYQLTPNSAVVIRVDGRAFHTYTHDLDRPFSFALYDSMNHAARAVAKEQQGFKLAYGQSDEYSFLITDFDTHETEGWFGYRLNKVTSITASTFTAHFNEVMRSHYPTRKKLAVFDARAFVVPFEDVPNVFVWRQRDWERNSLQMLAREHFSHAELMNKNREDIHEMLHAKGINWSDLVPWQKNGSWIVPGQALEFHYDRKTYDDIASIIQKALP